MNEDMTYSQSAKGITITHARALTELRTHGIVQCSRCTGMAGLLTLTK